jgi:hypothetical protein
MDSKIFGSVLVEDTIAVTDNYIAVAIFMLLETHNTNAV